MKALVNCFLLAFLLLYNFLFAQNFEIIGTKKHFKQKFQFIGNQIIIPISINNSENLNFILDTGSRFTIITNNSILNQTNFNSAEQITVTGLGREKTNLVAYKSLENKIQIKKLLSNNSEIILLKEAYLDLSSKLGVPIHGILGTKIFGDFIIKIDFKKQIIHFYESNYFNKKRLIKSKSKQND